MKVCPVNRNCIAFETFEEFKQAFERLGHGTLTDDTCVEGNSGLRFEMVKEWIEFFGLENVYFENSFEAGSVSTFFFDLRHAELKGEAWFINADEVSIEDGFLRLWFD